MTCLTWLAVLAVAGVAYAQSTRKPTRVKAPEFRADVHDVFFKDATSLLKGKLPDVQAKTNLTSPPTKAVPSASVDAGDDPLAWNQLITPTSLEDLVKGSKLRLEKIVTTPSAFASGGFAEARTEFSLLALMFAIIEEYRGDVRWQKNATTARQLMTRTAANAQVGSIQSYNAAKQRLLDLGDLVNGSSLAGEPPEPIDWANLMDRVPMMQLLEWSEQDYVSKLTSNPSEFQSKQDELRRYAELIAVLGKTAIQPDMPDADDDDYVAFARDMITQARQVVLAVETDNIELARTAAGKLGQSCINCHDNYR